MFDNVLLAQGRLKSGTRTGSHTDERLSEIASNILNKVHAKLLTFARHMALVYLAPFLRYLFIQNGEFLPSNCI